MQWHTLNSEVLLEEIKELSKNQKVLIFKHSTRCSISSMALNRLERAWKEDETQHLKPYFLDLISYRQISNKIAEVFEVQHQSPQALVIENGQCIYHNSHMGINYKEIIQQ
ncbi:bacillithiol system redox-active protein YtxJ [Rapidithrix thailandica]|uniref:Bacillithiol system redox-active protein YtxJ n=1 Tax=Rapidithrix thailandica TaxID=413964 RepID=A0AAW9S2Y1_9BACT